MFQYKILEKLHLKVLLCTACWDTFTPHSIVLLKYYFVKHALTGNVIRYTCSTAH